MPTVLVADDDCAQRELMAETIRVLGYDVVEAEDGAQALRLEQARRPDLVVLDGVMPGLDGWQVLGQMSRDPRLEGIPVVLISGCTRSASRLPHVVFLPKPVDPGRLLRKVKSLLENTRPTLVELPAAQP